jgi:hypothetical protein
MGRVQWRAIKHRLSQMVGGLIELSSDCSLLKEDVAPWSSNTLSNTKVLQLLLDLLEILVKL